MTSFDHLVPNAPAGRYAGVERPYTAADVERLRGSFPIAHTLAERGANKLWKLLHEEPYINSLGAMTGNQAMQMVRAGLKAIYLSGWQVAADSNTASSHVPGPVALSRQRRAGTMPAHQPHPAARRPDRARRGRRPARLVRPHRRRRRSRLRRPAEQLRDHEGLHRGGRRGRPLRGPARQREEVRPSRRQGANPHRRA